MKIRFIYYFLILHYFLCLEAKAQVNLYPVHFGQVMITNQLLNPSITNLEQATNASFGNQFYTGAFSKIDNLFFIGNINLTQKDSARYVSSLGIKFQNEKEGEFVERPKYYASYSFRTRINETYWLGLGLDLGRAGYNFKGTDVSTSGSASNWDGNFGLVFHSSSFCLTGSMNQIFNSLILPKNLYFRWKRFYSLYTEKTFDLGRSQISLYAQNKFLSDQADVLDIGTNLTLANVFLIGTNVWVGRNLSFLIGLKNISIEEHHFSLYMSYNMPISNSASANIQSFEMSLRYQFR
jgi:hypothetical protein